TAAKNPAAGRRMATVKRRDPVTAFHFGFRITRGPLRADYADPNGATAWFKAVSGLSVSTDIEDRNEGGVTLFTRKVVGMTKGTNIVLKNGFVGNKSCFHSCKHPRRVDALIVQLGHDLKPRCKWAIYNAYPVKWTGPDYDATKNELAIETLELVHEGIEMNPPPEEDVVEFQAGIDVNVDANVNLDVDVPGVGDVDVSANVDVDADVEI